MAAVKGLGDPIFHHQHPCRDHREAASNTKKTVWADQRIMVKIVAAP